MNASKAVFVVASMSALGCTAPPQASTHLPSDVAAFIERRNICDHFRGEEPYSPERRAELERESLKYCRGTDRDLAELRSRYRDNTAVANVLQQFETDIEPK